MQIIPIENIMEGRSILSLRALEPTRENFGVCLFQPDGPVEASERRIGHADPVGFLPHCKSFIETAVYNNADLVVTPEYSLPWPMMREICTKNSKMQPSHGAVWVLGFESITPEELQENVHLIHSNGHFVYHEPFDAARLSGKVYIDPLVYIFWSIQPDGEKQLTFIIQFKNAACRDYFNVEYKSLYTGTTAYSIRNNSGKTIKLLTIICSDTSVFDNIRDHYREYLLIHIQLNPKPTQRPYADYRDQLFNIGSQSDVELLCLNWASCIEEVKDDGSVEKWSNNAGSAWYAPESKFNPHPSFIDGFYKKGLYYSIPKPYWHAVYFHSEGHTLLLRKEKVYLDGVTYIERVTSWLSVQKRWVWNETSQKLEEKDSPDSMFEVATAHLPELQAAVSQLISNSAVNAERALELLSGPRSRVPEKWAEINQLQCMQLDATESICRSTVHQDNDVTSTGLKIRTARLQASQDAVRLKGKNISWPFRINDLEEGYILKWDKTHSSQNVETNTSKKMATLIYLGSESNSTVIQKAHDWAINVIYADCVSRGMKLPDFQKLEDRLCIVYVDDHKLKLWNPIQTYSITKTDSAPNSITDS